MYGSYSGDMALRHSEKGRYYGRIQNEDKCVYYDIVNDKVTRTSSGLMQCRTRHEKPWKCEYCSQRFSLTSELKIHRRVHFDEETFKCGYCKVVFSELSKLEIHMKIHASSLRKSFERGISEEKNSKLNADRRVQTCEETFKCGYCTAEFSELSEAEIHMKLTHISSVEKPYKNKYCEVEFSRLNVQRRVQTCEETFKCGYCKEEFCELSMLKIHILSHIRSVEKPYKCEHCNKTFTESSNLKTHKRIHSLISEMCYKCEVCDKRFSTPTEQDAHFKRIHIINKKVFTLKHFGCDDCNESFPTNKQLLDHTRGKHPDEKTFDYGYCDKRFISSRTLCAHKRKFHVGETCHKCGYCNKVFPILSKLNRHKRIHRLRSFDFKCEFCDETFTQMSKLKIHRRKHTGKKPFPCEYCDQSFYTLFRLNKHNRLHLSEKKHNCDKNDCIVVDTSWHVSAERSHRQELTHGLMIKDHGNETPNLQTIGNSHMQTYHHTEKEATLGTGITGIDTDTALDIDVKQEPQAKNIIEYPVVLPNHMATDYVHDVGDHKYAPNSIKLEPLSDLIQNQSEGNFFFHVSSTISQSGMKSEIDTENYQSDCIVNTCTIKTEIDD